MRMDTMSVKVADVAIPLLGVKEMRLHGTVAFVEPATGPAAEYSVSVWVDETITTPLTKRTAPIKFYHAVDIQVAGKRRGVVCLLFCCLSRFAFFLSSFFYLSHILNSLSFWVEGTITHSLTCSCLELALSWGQCFDPLVAHASMVIDLLDVGVDPSPPTPWFDKLR